MRKKIFFALLTVAMLVYMLVPSLAEKNETVRVASLKGPTTMGMVKLMHDSEAGETENDYDFMLSGTADEIVPLLVRGELDIALVPCNLASVLYNNTNGKVNMLAINTLGVLYVVETGDDIHSVEDLAGKTLVSTGKNTTPQYALDYVLKKNGLDPEKDLTVEYKSEATEVAAALLSGAAQAAMLPQPYVTSVLMQNENVRVALSLTDEWNKADPESALVTGVVLARAAFVQEHPEAVATFMDEYRASTEYVNANNAEAAGWIADLGIVAKAPLAEKALPQCNIVCITGGEMKAYAEGYLAALYEQNPESIGGKMPDEAFYYLIEDEEPAV